MPKHCGFRIQNLGGRGEQRRAMQEEQTEQCRQYGKYRHWALKTRGLKESELQELLASAAKTKPNSCGAADLSQALRRGHYDRK